MKVYLSGPMTGYPEWNYPAFRSAARRLRAEGHIVISPAENFDGDTTRERSVYMRLDIEALLKVDAVVVLHGWGGSKGARLEVAIAKELGLPVLRCADLEPANDTDGVLV